MISNLPSTQSKAAAQLGECLPSSYGPWVPSLHHIKRDLVNRSVTNCTWEAEARAPEGHPQLDSELKATLGYMRQNTKARRAWVQILAVPLPAV